MKSEDVDAVQHYVNYARDNPPSLDTVASALAAGGSTVLYLQRTRHPPSPRGWRDERDVRPPVVADLVGNYPLDCRCVSPSD